MKERKSIADRLKTAAKAKHALLEKSRAKLTANSADEPQRSAARLAIATARDIRAAERKAAKHAEQAKLDATRRSEEVAREAEIAATVAREADRISAIGLALTGDTKPCCRCRARSMSTRRQPMPGLPSRSRRSFAWRSRTTRFHHTGCGEPLRHARSRHGTGRKPAGAQPWANASYFRRRGGPASAVPLRATQQAPSAFGCPFQCQVFPGTSECSAGQSKARMMS